MTAAVTFDKPCPQCGGRGYIERPHPFATEREALEGTRVVEDWCYECAMGWLPDDATVEAAAKEQERLDRLATGDSEDWYDWPESFRDGYRRNAIALLVAAARYQSEGKP